MKLDAKNVLQGMPSLLQNLSLQFDKGWPKVLNLPKPFSKTNGGKTTQPEKARKFMQITDCQHYFRKHYAKNLCKNCYIKLGKGRPAYKCEHKDRAHYAMGVCQLCYLKIYNMKKNKQRSSQVCKE